MHFSEHFGKWAVVPKYGETGIIGALTTITGIETAIMGYITFFENADVWSL